eukprot:superscaffoldBa00003213_g16396
MTRIPTSAEYSFSTLIIRTIISLSGGESAALCSDIITASLSVMMHLSLNSTANSRYFGKRAAAASDRLKEEKHHSYTRSSTEFSVKKPEILFGIFTY